MAKQPAYPDDATVGDSKKDVPVSAAKKDEGSGRTRQIVTGAAIGIGSAALVAALLYANRSRKGGTPRD